MYKGTYYSGFILGKAKGDCELAGDRCGVAGGVVGDWLGGGTISEGME